MKTPAGWYYHEQKKGHVTYYGPFGDMEEVVRAAYFHRSVDRRDAAARDWKWFGFLAEGIGKYDENEVGAVMNDPGDDRKSSEVKPASKLDIHSSWQKFPEDSRERVYAGDRGLVQLRL